MGPWQVSSWEIKCETTLEEWEHDDNIRNKSW